MAISSFRVENRLESDAGSMDHTTRGAFAVIGTPLFFAVDEQLLSPDDGMPSGVPASSTSTILRDGRADMIRRRDDMKRRFAYCGSAVLALLTASSTLAGQLPPERIAELADRQSRAAFDLYRELLTWPNDANHPADILRLTEYLETQFAGHGFTTQRLEMPGSDAILATRDAPGTDRTVLIYLQADGQPVDTTAWHQQSPWTPTLKARREGATSVDGNPDDWTALPWERLYNAPDPEWRIFARSASDSKGPIAQFLSAIAILDEAGVTPDFDMKVIIDTEEEMGSPHLPAALERYREALAADMLVIFDGPPHTSGRPTLTFGARGIADVTLTAYGPRVAQHSGHWGNYVPNPALRLAQVLASMKDDEGRVTIPGFYDGVVIDAATRAILEAVPDDPAATHARMGIAAPDGLAATVEEAIQYPSINIRGMRAAWVGREARTIIPPLAVAEIDVRLVRESDPDRLLGLIRDHIAGLGYHIISGRDPTEDERARFAKIVRFDSSVSYLAFRTDFDSAPGRWLTASFERLFGETPIRLRTGGGSIPISPFVTTLGLPAVSVGTVNPDNNQHSPNENLRVFDFLRGIRIMAAVLSEPIAGF
jgi:acetylornithine deacetylase/succinyl-diaminopimelate desuccinylase-like protein